MPDVIGKDQKVASRVKWPPRSEKRFHVVLAEKRVPVGAGPVEYEYRVIDLPAGITVRRAESGVMNTHIRQDLTIAKPVVFVPCVRLGSACCTVVMCARRAVCARLHVASSVALLRICDGGSGSIGNTQHT